MIKEGFRYIKNNIDEIMILGVIHKITSNQILPLQPKEQVIVDAIKRSDNDLANASLDEISEKLSTYDADQIPFLVNNIKGIVHEIEFVELENEDGDSIFASMYNETNYPGYDVKLIDTNTGENWEVQLKATSNQSYVQDWIDSHPEGEIVVTNEIAQQMDLPSTGISNQDLTVNVTDFVDKLIEYQNNTKIWDYFPILLPISVGFIVYELWKRFENKEISKKEFQFLTIKATGIKATKFVLVFILLSIPIVNLVTGVALIAMLITELRNTGRNLLG